jgi:3-oxoacyl-[acyl-carrier protein] reductase
MLQIDLSDRIALVTGGSGQLGRTMVRTLARCGASIAIHYFRDEKTARELQEELFSWDVPCMIVQGDVTDETSVFTMRDAISANVGMPDIIVNNAVIQYAWKPILDQAVGDYESQYRSCVLQNVLMAKAFVPAMVQKDWGRVIAINTECSMQNFPGQSAYVAGKRGMDGVLRVLAKEVGPSQVTVNQIAPGWMISEESPAGESDAGYTSSVPLRRRGTDQDIANLAAYLASDLAGFITGQFISVSGGNVMPAI